MLLKTNGHALRRLTLFAISLGFSVYTAAQPQETGSPHAITSADSNMRRNLWPTTTNPLAYHAVHPVWTADERLWCRDAGPEGDKFVLFDPAKLTKEPLLWSPDSKKIATFKQDHAAWERCTWLDV